ncbi:MAG: hypothetical protein QOK28_1380 [Actinomycetota bacterium]
MTHHRRTILRLVLVASTLLTLVITAPAHAATSKTPVASLVLESQTPWVGAGGTFEIRIAAPAAQRDAADDLEYAISVHPASPTRSAFTNTLTNRPTTSPLAVITTPLNEAQADENGAVTLDVGVQDPTQPRDRTRVNLRGAGVYPVALELRTLDGAVRARLLTHLIFVPETPTGPKLAVGVFVPVRAPIALHPDGTQALAARDLAAIGGVARALATLPSTGVLLQPAPETLAALLRQNNSASRDVVAALQAIAPGHAIVSSPFIPTEAAATSESERVASRDRGGALITATFGNAAQLSDIAVVDDPADDRLVGEPPRRLVVREGVLQPATLRFTTAEPITVRRSGSRATTPALLADAGLSAHLQNGASPVLAAQHLLADLATVYFDSPGRFRSIVVLPSKTWRADERVLTPLLAGLASSPILEAATPTRLYSLATGKTVPRSRTLVTTPTSSNLPGNFATTRRTIDSLRSVMADAPDALQSFDDRLLIAESTVLTAAQRRQYVSDLAAAVADERHKFQLPTGGSLTLTARRGGIPITVRSTANYPARVLLQVASDRLKFPGGATRMMHLTRHDTTERFTVQSLGSGAFPLRILLKSPDGKVLLGQTRLTIRSTNASGVGIGLSIGAGLFLLLWWYRHSSRRRRERRA